MQAHRRIGLEHFNELRPFSSPQQQPARFFENGLVELVNRFAWWSPGRQRPARWVTR